MNSPIDFRQQMDMNYFNLQPSQVKGSANRAVLFNKRYLYNKLYSVYQFTLPDHWSMNWFRFWLFQFGSIGVVYSRKYGWIDQPYSIIHLDMEFNPKEILVYNTFIPKEIYGLIGYNAGIIHLMDDYYGLDDLVTYYAELLSQVGRSVNVNLMNANMTLLGKARNKKQAQEIKEAHSKATTGEPLVVVNSEVLSEDDLVTLVPNIKNNYIAGELMETRRSIVNAFLTEIGIRNVSVQKKERLVSNETSENNDETRAIATVIYENIKRDMDMINRISGLSLGVEMRYEYTSQISKDSGEVSL